jgi:small subunit ribosomal protein S16
VTDNVKVTEIYHNFKKGKIMAVKIRMTRMGRRHRPFFRINAIESRAPRDGKIIEKLGHYDPIEKNPDKQVVLNRERIEYWLGQGAIPSDTVSQILLLLGIKNKYAENKTARLAKARSIAVKKGKFFTQAQKIAAQKEAEAAEAKAEAEAKAKAEEEKAKAKAKEEKAKAEEEAKAKAQEEKAKETESKVKAEEEVKDQTEAEPEKVKADSEEDSKEK